MSQIKEVTSQDNMDLFQNVPEVSGDGSSGWEASFQSSDSRNQPENSKSVDPFISSPVDLADHIDSVFGGGESVKDGKPNEDSVPVSPKIDNWTEEDPFNNPVSETLYSAAKDDDRQSPDIVKDLSSDNFDWFQNEPVDKDVKFTASRPFNSAINYNNLTHPSSGSVDWFHDNQWQLSIMTTTNDKVVNEDEGSFDEWNDFTSFSNPQAPSSINAVSEPISDINIFTSPCNIQELDLGSFFSGGPSSERQGDSTGNSAENISDILHPKDDVKMLLSQMHFLSFMLENNLSVPSKSEAVGSFSHD